MQVIYSLLMLKTKLQKEKNGSLIQQITDPYREQSHKKTKVLAFSIEYT